jgi:hypothetical protein
MYLQTLGGAVGWITLLVFLFSGMSAWSSPSMMVARNWLPWLNFAMLMGAGVVGIFCLQWLQHKYAQPSVMVYWSKMFWEQDNPMRKAIEAQEKRLNKIQETLDEIIRQNNKEHR